MRVCQSVAISACSNSTLRERSVGVSGKSRTANKRAISRSASSMLLRCTSVGCAVKTGDISASEKKLCTAEALTPASCNFVSVEAMLPDWDAEPANKCARLLRL